MAKLLGFKNYKKMEKEFKRLVKPQNIIVQCKNYNGIGT